MTLQDSSVGSAAPCIMLFDNNTMACNAHVRDYFSTEFLLSYRRDSTGRGGEKPLRFLNVCCGGGNYPFASPESREDCYHVGVLHQYNNTHTHNIRIQCDLYILYFRVLRRTKNIFTCIPRTRVIYNNIILYVSYTVYIAAVYAIDATI